MPVGISTLDSRGLAPQTGNFSAPVGVPVNQSFFDAAFAARIHDDKIYKEAYNCNMVGNCTMSTWIEQYTGYETSCYPEYTLLERLGRTHQIKISVGAVVPAYPATAVLRLDNSSQYVGGQYVSPQVGNFVVLTPNGNLAKIIAVTHATANDTTITVQQYSQTATPQTVQNGDVLLVLTGSVIEDCGCPVGQFRFDDMPIEHDLKMFQFGDKGELCGDALNKCQYFMIPFTSECGEEVSVWYTEALKQMYQDHEWSKHFQRLLNPNFGIIPTIKARGIKFTPALTTAITADDVRAWKGLLDQAGIMCKEYAVFAGREIYSQFQRMLRAEGITQLDNSLQPLQDCKWLNMEWCGIRVEGMVLHIYEECSFSNGKLLGSANMVYPNSAIFVPMCDRTTNCRGAYDNKMISTVYFKSQDGRVWDNVTDSNGILNGANGRNTFGTGCEEHEWTIKSRFLQEVHCPNFWGYIGL